MKRSVIILFAVFIFLLLTLVFIKPLIINLAGKQLENIFIDSRVSIGSCVFKPEAGLSLFDIEIKRRGVYDIKVKESSLLYGLKLKLKSPVIRVSTPKKPAVELAGYIKAGKGKPFFRSVEISGLDLDLNTLDLTFKAGLDLNLDLITQEPDYLNLKVDNFSMSGVLMENLSLVFGPGTKEGRFTVVLLKYDKLKVSDIKGNIKLRDKLLSIYSASARALDGTIEMVSELETGKTPRYLAKVKCVALDIEKFVRDFNLGDKFDMTGRLSGSLRLQGRAGQIEILEGDFSTLPPGGTLIIKDARFLGNMAQATNQPVSLLVESFKNYRYNIGVMDLGFEEGNILLQIGLEGEAGKRSFNVILHDLK